MLLRTGGLSTGHGMVASEYSSIPEGNGRTLNFCPRPPLGHRPEKGADRRPTISWSDSRQTSPFRAGKDRADGRAVLKYWVCNPLFPQESVLLKSDAFVLFSGTSSHGLVVSFQVRTRVEKGQCLRPPWAQSSRVSQRFEALCQAGCQAVLLPLVVEVLSPFPSFRPAQSTPDTLNTHLSGCPLKGA